jgi:hypothetical protein
MAAVLFYSLVSVAGGNVCKSAQDKQIAYNNQDICVAKCPTTQDSGGQGGTTLVIDMLHKQGKFPVSYEMYTVPDHLTIYYEGKVLYDTGGLVSVSRSFDISFKGTSTKIKVVVYAPIAGTGWDIYISCPTA